MLNKILHNKFNFIAIAIIISLIVFNYLILFNDILSRPYIIPPGSMDDLATHSQFINNILKTQNYISLDNMGYPPGFHLFFSAMSLITGISPLELIKWLYLIFPILSLAAIYLLVRKLFGQLNSIFVLFTYGMLSLQPFLNLSDGSFVSIISINYLMILAMLYLLLYIKNPNKYFLLILSFVLGSAIVIYSAIACFYFIPLAIAIILASIIIGLITKKNNYKILIYTIIPYLIVIFIFTKITMGKVYFDAYLIKFSSILTNLIFIFDTNQTSIPESTPAVLAAIPKFDNLFDYTGNEIFYLGIIGFIVIFFLQKINIISKVFLIIWTILTLILSLSNIFILPARFARDLAMPFSILAAILLGLCFNLLVKKPLIQTLFICLIAIFSITVHIDRYSKYLSSQTRIEAIDFDSMKWVNDNLPKNTIVLNGPYTNYLNIIDTNHDHCNSGIGLQPATLDLKKINNTIDKHVKCDYVINYSLSNKSKDILKELSIDYIYATTKVNNWSDPRTHWKYFNELKKADYLIPLQTFEQNNKTIIIYQVNKEKL